MLNGYCALNLFRVAREAIPAVQWAGPLNQAAQNGVGTMSHKIEFQSGGDCLIDYMLFHNIPISRENYLKLAFVGDVPELDAELEAGLPEIIRDIRPDSKTTQ